MWNCEIMLENVAAPTTMKIGDEYVMVYRGIFHTIFKNGSFSQETGFDYTTASNSGMLFPPDPPGDPTLVKIDNVRHYTKQRLELLELEMRSLFESDKVKQKGLADFM